MDMIDAHDAHNPFTGIVELEILAKIAKLFSDVLQWEGGGQTWNLSALSWYDDPYMIRPFMTSYRSFVSGMT